MDKSYAEAIQKLTKRNVKVLKLLETKYYKVKPLLYLLNQEKKPAGKRSNIHILLQMD